MRNIKQFLRVAGQAAALASALLAAGLVQAAAPGIAGPTFDLVAAEGYISQPDGASIYSWGYGCNSAPAGFVPANVAGAKCNTGQMQLPGPTLVVNEGDVVSVTLTNKLPKAAGNTSILFPGFNVCAGTLDPSTEACSGTLTGNAGVLTQEAAASGGTVTYSFVAKTPGTHSYYSGTQGDLQVEMGLYGALIVLPKLDPTTGLPSGYQKQAGLPDTCFAANGTTLPNGHPDYRLTSAAFNHVSACFEREYLFQFSELDPRIHSQALAQKDVPCAQAAGCMVIDTEPYHPVYFMINGRSMPDDMDPNYAAQYPLQPYNGNPHMHPGELVLVRIIGQGRMQHPFHEHANHVRLLARDGNLLINSNNKLAGPLLFTTSTTPGQTMDGIFQYTAKGLNWDVYAHTQDTPISGPEGNGGAPCIPDANGYYTTGSGALPTAPNYYEWCADHKKPLESKPFGQVGKDGPVTLPDPTVLVNGAWYAGSPYFGPDATVRAVGPTAIPPFGTIANDPGSEAGFAYMWHSHNEREITTNNIFPGGMMMMMLVDPWVFPINESN